MNVLERRRQLLATGYPVIPLYGKAPPNTKNNKTSAKPHRLAAAWRHHRRDAGDVGEDLARRAEHRNPDARRCRRSTSTFSTRRPSARSKITSASSTKRSGPILVRIGKPPKRAIPFRTIEPFAKFVVNLTAPNGADREDRVSRPTARRSSAFGIHPETKQPYRWHGGAPGETKLEELPYIRGEAAHQLVDELVQILVDRFGYIRAKERPGKRKDKGNGQDADEPPPIRTARPPTGSF